MAYRRGRRRGRRRRTKHSRRYFIARGGVRM